MLLLMASPLPWLGWLTGAEPCQRAARDLVQDCLLNIRSYPITGRSPIRHLGTRLVGVLSSPEPRIWPDMSKIATMGR